MSNTPAIILAWRLFPFTFWNDEKSVFFFYFIFIGLSLALSLAWINCVPSAFLKLNLLNVLAILFIFTILEIFALPDFKAARDSVF